MTTTIDLELTDRLVLNIIQSRFPLVERPYLAMAEELGVSEDEVIKRIRGLKQRNVVRQVNAIFDTRRVGYRTTLVAFSYEPGKLHRGALRVNRHPGVSHNYAREGSYFNLWFTLAVPPNESLEETVARMARETEAQAYRILPTLKFFKIGVNFDMVQERGASYQYYSPDGYTQDGGKRADWNKPEPLTDFEVEVIKELQEDLPLTPRPFDGMAQRLGITVGRLFEYAADFQRRGVMRRYSAVLHHRRAGFKANAMIVWRVPPERSEEVGRIMASHPAVSHCYERPTFPDWPYSHFSMVHATSREQCEEIGQELAAMTGIEDRLLLYSTREYKKTRVRYFV